MNRVIRTVIFTLLVMLLAISLVYADTINTPKRTVIAFECEQYTVAINKSQTITPIVQNYKGSVSYTYSSSDPTIATVDKNGKVTGKRGGETLISCVAIAGEKEFNVSYTLVVIVPIKRITTDKRELTMCTEETYAPQLVYEPTDATNKVLSWTSSDRLVAYVDDDGIIHADCIGKCTITGMATDGSNAKVTINVEVPGVVFSTKELIVDNPNGATFTYWKNKNKSRQSSLFTDSSPSTSDYFTVYEINADGTISYNSSSWKPATVAVPSERRYGEHNMIVYPKKKGNDKYSMGRLIYDGKDYISKSYSISIKVTREAVYETVKFSDYGKNKKLLGQRFSIEGTIIDYSNKNDISEIILNIDDTVGQYVIVMVDAINVPQDLKDNDHIIVHGIFEYIGEYTAKNGLAYDAPVFTAEQLFFE